MNEIKTSVNLKYLRRKIGLKQHQIRNIFNITRSTWSNYENGVTTPSVIDLINFSRYFGISLDELILHDLESRDPSPLTVVKKSIPRRVLYAFNDAMSAAAEPDIQYVLDEIKRLRDEIKTLKDQ
jgi:transcriptional regulator with XRE-family HTH domain